MESIPLLPTAPPLCLSVQIHHTRARLCEVAVGSAETIWHPRKKRFSTLLVK